MAQPATMHERLEQLWSFGHSEKQKKKPSGCVVQQTLKSTYPH